MKLNKAQLKEMIKEVVRKQLSEGMRTMAAYDALSLNMPFETFSKMLEISGVSWGKWAVVRRLENITPEQQQAIRQIKEQILGLSRKMAEIIASGDNQQS